MKWWLGLVIVVLLSAAAIVSNPSFGARPSQEAKNIFETSKHFNQAEGVFENRRPNLIAEMRSDSMNWGVISDFLKGGPDRVPTQKLPEVKPDLNLFVEPSKALKIIWLGHTTFLLSLEGKIVLVDPVFGPSASPFSFMVKRFQAPVITLEELPKIDFVLISHDHYDHLDMSTIKYFADKKTHFITPLGLSAHLKQWGVARERISESDWWQSRTLGGIEFIATPAQHFSGRGVFDANETLWASWVIQTENHNIYFSGDSGYDTHFVDIGEKYGPFEVAFIESGQYNENWKAVHMMPEESMQAFMDLKAKRYFPVHWGMFELSLHSWYEPIERLTKLSQEKGVELLSPKLGQMITLDGTTEFEQWWKL